jgi:DNA polymerase III subunit alpha
MREFVHLHVHTEYSLREGALRIKDCMAIATELGMSAVAITDTNALYGAVAFYRAAKAAGVKPIIGVQLSVGHDEDRTALADARPGSPATDTAVLLAENFQGYQNLVRLVTLAQTRSRSPFVTFSEVSNHRAHVLALIGGGESAPLRLFSGGQTQEAERWLTAWQTALQANQMYIDVQDHGIPDERKGLPALVKWARAAQLPLVATNDVHYAKPEDAETQNVLAQIEGTIQSRLLQGDRYHFATVQEMEQRFSKLPEAMANTLVIAERCNCEIPLNQTLLPKYPTLTKEPADVVLRRAAEAGIHQRFSTISDDVRERLDYELSVIGKMGFADYFLVVADFIRFAHKNGISTGPGRGSAAASLVAYALRITDVDPMRHHLLFERFLNPERISWPDIDTDFEFERRGEVIRYVVERYGPSHVAQIGTFGTMAARAAIRDAGRVLKTDAKIVDQLAKMIPSYPGVTLAKAKEEVKGISDLLLANQYARQLWEAASGLEGFPRHTSVHAAGVVISPIPLSDLVPVQAGGDGTPVTQYAMADIEHLGLIKMDFLGLRTLSLIDECVAGVSTRTGQRFDWRVVPDEDPVTFRMLSKGETNGCFQLESAGMRRVLRDLRPSTFEELVAVNALYRPGPMDNISTFIAAKHGRTAIHYPHPDLEPILKNTYGVIVYQEQIMQIAWAMAGFSLGQADLLRRAVGKKKRDVLDAERARFVTGCQVKGYSEEEANHVYDLIVRFADYGFPRSHAAAYAVLAYRTAYLRAHHMADFLAALMSSMLGDAIKIKDYTKDAKQHGIEVLPPSVTESRALYSVASDVSIRTGLLAVRNVGRGAVEAILSARDEQTFTSLADFLSRVNGRVCNRKAVESLLEAGALNDFLPHGATVDVGHQILMEAYRVAEEGKQSDGLGLRFEDGRQQPDRGEQVLYIRYDTHGQSNKTGVLPAVKSILNAQQGMVRVALYDKAKSKVRLLESRWSVTLTPELISMLEEIVGIGNAKIGHMPKSP